MFVLVAPAGGTGSQEDTMVQVANIAQPVRVGTARRVKVLSGWEHAALFELSTPFAGFTFVIASGINDEFAHEAMLLGANADGSGPHPDLHAVRGTDGWGDLFQSLGYLVTF